MDIKQIITATVAVILICLVAIPIIDAGAKTVYSEEIQTNQRYNVIESGTLSATLRTGAATGEYTFAGETITGSGTTIIYTDSLFIYLYTNNVSVFNRVTNTYTTWTATDTDVITFSEDGTFSYTSTSSGTVNGTYSNIVYPSEKGDYGVFSTKFNCNKGQQVMLFETVNPRFIGTMVDGVVGEYIIKPFSSSSNTMTDYTGTLSYQITATESEDGLSYVYDNFKVNATESSGSSTTNYVFAIAPLTYKYMSDNDSTIFTLLNLIPILLIAALLIGIGYTLMKRD